MKLADQFIDFGRQAEQPVEIVLVGPLLALGASFWLVPSFGIVAVGWAWLASQTLTAVVLVFTLMKPILR